MSISSLFSSLLSIAFLTFLPFSSAIALDLNFTGIDEFRLIAANGAVAATVSTNGPFSATTEAGCPTGELAVEMIDAWLGSSSWALQRPCSKERKSRN